MITKKDWKKIIQAIDRFQRHGYEVYISERKIVHTKDDKIYCVPERVFLEEGISKVETTIYKHPDSLNDYTSPTEIERKLEIRMKWPTRIIDFSSISKAERRIK